MMNDNQNQTGRYEILNKDPWLNPYEGDIVMRMNRFYGLRNLLTNNTANLSDFANGHLYYGFHRTKDGWIYREWAPAADSLSLIGDFNRWDPLNHELKKMQNGDWEIEIPAEDNLDHLSRVKVRVTHGRQVRDRIPLYIRKVIQDEKTKDVSGQIWDPPKKFTWTDKSFYSKKTTDDTAPFIYEAHVGMAQNKDGVGTYTEFKENVLPRIKNDGYNTIQLMGIMEHPYYASFGYQVSNFFAASSWFGNPDELKDLIDTAHKMGIRVLMDLVQSHSVKNIYEGINEFDGTAEQFFYAGSRGDHQAWGSKLFNYGKYEVIHFLLSNIKYWMTEFHFDGFRFDGVTSMIYLDHGLGVAFDHYDRYYSPNTDYDALIYLQLANSLIREIKPDAITIAEDMSGMPGMCLPISEGGIGFDYRLSMGVPDYWIRTLKTQRDEDLEIGKMWNELVGRRPYERNIGYCESHDQALVGDKTIIFWLADKEMYDGMSVDSNNLLIDRAIALHKMIRFVTMSLAGEGYLNFIGNEFGHPEWLDFPREGNNWSYHYAKRRWDLVDRDDLYYKVLNQFDMGMLRFAQENRVLGAWDLMNLWIGEHEKVLAFRKAGLIFLFNFHHTWSIENYELPVPYDVAVGSRYKVVFDSDAKEFGGQNRISRDVIYEVKDLHEKYGKKGIQIYSPSRTVLVLKEVP